MRVDPNTEDEYTSYPFTGTYQPLLGQPMYVLKNKAGANGLTAFVYGENANLLPFQAYLKPQAGVQGAPSLNFTLTFDDSFMETDGIEGINEAREASSNNGYTLDGKRAADRHARGIVIKNNKKYMAR